MEPESRTSRSRKRRVLVVDDRRDARHLTRVLLETLGHDVAVASSGGEALDRVADSAPEIVLCDVVMPDMDGLEVARRIRAGFPDVVLVAMTAEDDGESRRRAADAGFHGYLVKPVSVNALQELLADARL